LGKQSRRRLQLLGNDDTQKASALPGLFFRRMGTQGAFNPQWTLIGDTGQRPRSVKKIWKGLFFVLDRFAPYWLWALLSLPPILWLNQAMTSTNPRVVHMLIHPTGEWAARILILTMMISPLLLLFKNRNWARWLRKNRRYFGVAAFGYAALHTAFYLVDKGSMDRVITELPRFYIWTGWAAFAIFVPMAVTSMDYFVRVMGTWWKWLQRWTYAAAVLVLLHWASLHQWEHPMVAFVHFAPLAALEAYRIWYWYLRGRTPATTINAQEPLG
jgi:sulfoxide reductase heme-binding subunit YedZ